MADRPQSSTSRIMILLLLAVLGTVSWWVAPIFLPVFRWTKVDFAKIASSTQLQEEGLKLSEAQLRRVFDVEFAYQPRGKNDPRPYVIMKMDPPWHVAMEDEDLDETGILVRGSVISDRDGFGLSAFYLGSGQAKDRYFRAKCWRFPVGSFGKGGGQGPVLMFDSFSVEKFSIMEADIRENEIRRGEGWEVDELDDWVPSTGE